MENPLETGLAKMVEQAEEFVAEIGDELFENEALRAWDAVVYPLLYSTCALYSSAASALIRSAAIQ
ncbi:MAG TPA: hypothetical protein VMU18_08400 [Rhodoblastus sp.]|nr:hypothetical protein [Rhodoblastus sp.]